MVLIIRFSMACPKLDFIVGPAILLYFATVITELVSSVPVGLLQVCLLINFCFDKFVKSDLKISKSVVIFEILQASFLCM